MNRIQHSPQKKPSLSTSKSSRRSAAQPIDANLRQQQSLFVPLHYESNYAYPLLVWLHGPNDSHQQIKTIMPHVSVRNYVAVAPAMPELASDASQSENGFPGDDQVAQRLVQLGKRWEDGFEGIQAGGAMKEGRTKGWDSTWSQSREMIAAAQEAVEAGIARAMARCNIAPHRIFLAGLESGGTMAIRLALSTPERFAGVASIGGGLPRGLQPMSNLLRARRLPVLIAHGRDSQDYPVGQLCDELRLFHVAGMSLNVRQYPCGQELTTQMLTDLDAWMMQIVTGVDMTAVEENSDNYLPRNGAN